MKPFTNALREQIIQFKKKRLDIANLIKDVDIKGQDLSGTFISELSVPDQDMRETNFANAILGTKDTVINFNRAILDGSCFSGVTCPGEVWARRASLKNCNFKNAYIPYADYKYADFRRANFCNMVFMIGTNKAVGAIFDKDFFKELTKHWGLVVLYQNEYDELVRKGEQNGIK